jgi:hypothetical protein
MLDLAAAPLKRRGRQRGGPTAEGVMPLTRALDRYVLTTDGVLFLVQDLVALAPTAGRDDIPPSHCVASFDHLVGAQHRAGPPA